MPSGVGSASESAGRRVGRLGAASGCLGVGSSASACVASSVDLARRPRRPASAAAAARRRRRMLRQMPKPKNEHDGVASIVAPRPSQSACTFAGMFTVSPTGTPGGRGERDRERHLAAADAGRDGHAAPLLRDSAPTVTSTLSSTMSRPLDGSADDDHGRRDTAARSSTVVGNGDLAGDDQHAAARHDRDRIEGRAPVR